MSITSAGSSFPAWTSPLKADDRFQPYRSRPNPQARRSLPFGNPGVCATDPGVGEEKKDFTPTYESISSYYKKIDFLQIPVGKGEREFFEIREIVLQIETSIHEQPSININIIAMRRRIEGLLCSFLNHTLKMGELGMILFYLDHPEHSFPEQNLSLIAYRAAEIEAEAHSLIEQHKSICTNNLVASGKTHYLLRAFAHMAMTSTKVYNKGGLYALLSILESHEYGVAGFLRMEHYEHILVVIRQILVNPAFEALFQRRVNVHPDLQDAIRIDLKLNPNEHVSSTHVFLDCFMFLFNDIRQINRPNCYAIAALIYVIENAPYKIVESMITWLNQGHFAFNDHINIPIAPLLAKRLVCTGDLQVKLPPQHAYSLKTFRHISSILNIIPHEQNDSNEPVPLQASLRTILYSGKAIDLLPYAAKLYYAYKYNALCHLALGVMEFTHNNSPEKYRLHAQYSKTKETCLNNFVNMLHCKLISQIPEQDNLPLLLNRIFRKLGERLWFENCSEIDACIKEDVIHAGSKKIYNFEGSLGQLLYVLKNSLRVFHLKSGEYQLIDTFTDLQQILCEAVDESARELKQERGLLYRQTVLAAKQYFNSDVFASSIARYAAGQIQQRGISEVSLIRSNLLLFKQVAGFPQEILQHVFKIQVETQRILGADTPYQFALSFLKKVHELDITTLFRVTPKILAFTIGSHIWTISPKRLRLFLNLKTSFHSFIQSTIFDRANTRMQSIIPQDILHAVIIRYTKKNTFLRKRILEYLGTFSCPTYRDLKEALLKKTFNNYSRVNVKAMTIMDDEFSKVRVSGLDLQNIFNRLNFEVSDPKQFEIFNSFYNKWLHPYQVARQLRELLIQHKIGIVDSYDLEHVICDTYNFPISIDLGDLNWGEMEYREDPPHTRLVIRYNWSETKLSFYHRESEKEFIKEGKEFEHFEFQHPAMRHSPHTYW